MLDLERETKLIIETLPDGKFTFQVVFRGEVQPASRPMENREDAALLGNVLIKQLQRKALARSDVAAVPAYASLQVF